MAQKNRRNYYRILHVQPDAPAAVIKSSYRALMLKLEMHPDHGGEHWNASVINEAYQLLSDPERRASYDRDLEWGWAAGRSARSNDFDGHSRCVFCGDVVIEWGEAQQSCLTCLSPLTPAAKLNLPSPDRRGAHRVKRAGALKYYTSWPQKRPYTGLLEDISPNGMRFLGDIEVGEHHILKIDSRPIAATARVAYCRPSERRDHPYAIGADFFTAEFRRLAGTFVSTTA